MSVEESCFYPLPPPSSRFCNDLCKDDSAWFSRFLHGWQCVYVRPSKLMMSTLLFALTNPPILSLLRGRFEEMQQDWMHIGCWIYYHPENRKKKREIERQSRRDKVQSFLYIYTVKKVSDFPSPSRKATNLFLQCPYFGMEGGK